jgi:hypothetical protein
MFSSHIERFFTLIFMMLIVKFIVYVDFIHNCFYWKVSIEFEQKRLKENKLTFFPILNDLNKVLKKRKSCSSDIHGCHLP